MTVKELVEKLKGMPEDLSVAVCSPTMEDTDDGDSTKCYPIGDIEHVDGDSEFVCIFLEED